MSAPGVLIEPTAVGDPEEWLIVDCRHRLADPEAGRQAWSQARLPGAHHLHLDRDLSGPLVPGPRGPLGGRHPLPEPQTFAATMRSLGLSADSRVLAYDDAGGPFAARLWWVLRWLGFGRVSVLNGGIAAWTAAGGRLSAGPPGRGLRQGDWIPRADDRWILPPAEVADFGGTLIDSRDADRYRGEREPLDPSAGHIPGAVNRPWRDLLDESGRLVSAPHVPHGAAFYCGSGVTACVHLLALASQGREDGRLFVGSWSGWLARGGQIAVGGGPGESSS